MRDSFRTGRFVVLLLFAVRVFAPAEAQGDQPDCGDSEQQEDHGFPADRLPLRFRLDDLLFFQSHPFHGLLFVLRRCSGTDLFDFPAVFLFQRLIVDIPGDELFQLCVIADESAASGSEFFHEFRVYLRDLFQRGGIGFPESLAGGFQQNGGHLLKRGGILLFKILADVQFELVVNIHRFVFVEQMIFQHIGLHDFPSVAVAEDFGETSGGSRSLLHHLPDVFGVEDRTAGFDHRGFLRILNLCASGSAEIVEISIRFFSGYVFDVDELKQLRLEGTDEQIPTFDEVLALFEHETPLIIELKTARGNHKALAKAVCERLDSYQGEFCIESFDPFALIDVKKLRPEICRGQLSMNFEKDKAGLPWYKRFIAGNLLLNFLTVPDFIAYKFEDRSSYCLRSCVRVWGAQEVDWTIRTKEDLLACEAAGGIPIFERFDPEV